MERISESVYFYFYVHNCVHYQFKQLRLVSKLDQKVPHDLGHDQKKTHVQIVVSNCSHYIVLTTG